MVVEDGVFSLGNKRRAAEQLGITPDFLNEWPGLH
ncbi:hypothetical protein HRbin36_02763 [bacterium HR36]|nr:hypothetical protein HRbin36_02763 [bacterium HR36]